MKREGVERRIKYSLIKRPFRKEREGEGGGGERDL